jgi:hypothetical protein
MEPYYTALTAPRGKTQALHLSCDNWSKVIALMVRYYSDEDIKILEDERAQLRSRCMQLQEHIMQHQFRNRRAEDFAKYGFLRRLSTLVRCIENAFFAIPPEFDEVPTLDQTQDIMIQVQSFIFNLFGCLDNLAWTWVLERDVTKPDGQPLPRGWIGLRPDNEIVRQSLGQGLRKILGDLDNWFTYLGDFRHALAHQIPLYVPPFSIAPENVEKYCNLERSILEAIVQRNEAKLQVQERERDRLRFFRPWIVGSRDGQHKTIQFHTQLLTDFKTIEAIGAGLLDDLVRSPT